MIAVDKKLIENLFLETEVKNLKDSRFIDETQCSKIINELALPNTNGNFLVRFGFLLLGILLYSSIAGAIAFVSFQVIEDYYQILLFLFAGIGLFGAELLAKNKYYAHGLDDAFILGFQLFICAAVSLSFENGPAIFLTMAVAGVFCCIRYVNTMSSILAMIGIVGFFGILVTELHLLPTLFLPFLMLLIAIGLYFLYYKLIANSKLFIYQNGITMIQIFSLLLGYFSVNYMVVRVLSEELMGISTTPNSDIPLAWIFYAMSFIFPIGYIAFSLIKKDRVLLIVGLLTMAFSIFTIRYYYFIFPLEIELLLGGIVLFSISLILIRRLKDKKTGITFMKDRNAQSEYFAYLQAIIVNSQTNIHSAQVEESPMSFGGGGFSGGGSSDSF